MQNYFKLRVPIWGLHICVFTSRYTDAYISCACMHVHAYTHTALISSAFKNFERMQYERVDIMTALALITSKLLEYIVL